MLSSGDFMPDVSESKTKIRLSPLPRHDALPESHSIGYMCVPKNFNSKIPIKMEGPAAPDYLYRSKSSFARRKICDTEFFNRGTLPMASGMKLPLLV
jgi:hypothetical protein